VEEEFIMLHKRSILSLTVALFTLSAAAGGAVLLANAFGETLFRGGLTGGSGAMSNNHGIQLTGSIGVLGGGASSNAKGFQLAGGVHGDAGGPLSGEGKGGVEGEGQSEGEGEGEGATEGVVEGEGATEGAPFFQFHSADQNENNMISLSELLRVIQFFNSNGYQCAEGTEDGYAPNQGATDCVPHSSDYNPQNWIISLSELLRLIQFFNTGGYTACPAQNTEDGFCPGLPTP